MNHRFEQTLIGAQALERETIALLCTIAGTAAGVRELICQAAEVYFDRGGNPERLYEAILQTYLFAGFPAAIEGFKAVHAVATERQVAFVRTFGEPYQPEHFLARGEALFQVIYGDAAERVRRFIGSLSPDLEQWMLIEGYGKVLSRPSALSLLERELAAVVALAVGGWLAQLRWHLRATVALGATSSVLADALACAAIAARPEHIIAAQQIADSL